MRVTGQLVSAVAISIAAIRFVPADIANRQRVVHVVDTLYVEQVVTERFDYDKLAALVVHRMKKSAPNPTVIDGDLIVNGRLGIRGAPEPQTDHALTIQGKGTDEILFESNEAMQDPQRTANQHRHVGSIGVEQDGGMRFSQNSICYADTRGCAPDDKLRRVAYAGYDSMGDMSFFLADVDSTTGVVKGPVAQSLVLNLLAWDGNIHISALRPNQRILFNASTTPNASDLVWEVPLFQK
jgi:hypothetical protein